MSQPFKLPPNLAGDPSQPASPGGFRLPPNLSAGAQEDDGPGTTPYAPQEPPTPEVPEVPAPIPLTPGAVSIPAAKPVKFSKFAPLSAFTKTYGPNQFAPTAGWEDPNAARQHQSSGRNALQDAGGIVQSGMVLSNLASRRAFETLVGQPTQLLKDPLQAALEFQRLTGPLAPFNYAWDAIAGNKARGVDPLLRQEDYPQALQSATDMARDAYNIYGIGMTKPDFLPGIKRSPGFTNPAYPNVSDPRHFMNTELIGGSLGKEFHKAPFSTALNTGIPFFAGKLLGPPLAAMGGRVASRVADAGLAAAEMQSKGIKPSLAGQAAKKTVDFFGAVPPELSALAPDWLKDLMPAGYAHKRILQALAQLDDARRMELIMSARTLQKYWTRVPDPLKRQMLNAAEWTDKRAMAAVNANFDAQRYLQELKFFNRKAQLALGIPDAVNLRAKYGGAYLRIVNTNRQATRRAAFAEYQQLVKAKSSSAESIRNLTGEIKKLEAEQGQAFGKESDMADRIGHGYGDQAREFWREEHQRIHNQLQALRERLKLETNLYKQYAARRPQVLAEYRDAGPLRYEDIPQAAIERFARRVEAAGIEPPAYLPIVSQGALKAELTNAYGKVMGGMTTKKGKPTALSALAKKNAKEGTNPYDVEKQGNVGFLQPREKATVTPGELNLPHLKGRTKQFQYGTKVPDSQTQTPGVGPIRPEFETRTNQIGNAGLRGGVNAGRYATDVNELAELTLSRFINYKYNYDLIKTILETDAHIKKTWMYPKRGKPQGWEAFEVKDWLKAHEPSGEGQVKIDQLFKTPEDEVVYVPAGLKAILDEHVYRKPSDPTTWMSGKGANPLRKTGQLFSKIFFAKPTFAATLPIQNLVVTGLATKSPKDALARTVAAVISTNPEAAELITQNMTLSSHSAMFNTDPITKIAVKSFANRIGDNINTAMSLSPNAAYMQVDAMRRAEVMYYLLYRLEGADSTVRRMALDMMQVDEAIARLKQVANDPVALAALKKHMKGFFGDYRSITATQFKGLNDIMPISAWLRHSTNLLMTLPMQAPVKMGFMSMFQSAMGQYQDPGMNDYTKKAGKISIKNRDGSLKLGANGMPIDYSGPSLSPIGTATEAGKALIEIGLNSGEQVHLPLEINAAVTAPIEYVTGMNTYTGEPFKNPDLAPAMQGQQDPRTGVVKERVVPPVPLLIGKHFSPYWTGLMQAASSFPNRPSDFSYPGHPAPARYENSRADNYQQPIADPSALFNALMGIHERERSRTAEDAESMKEYIEHKNQQKREVFNDARHL